MIERHCILCGSTGVHHFYEDTSPHHASDYYRCANCTLIFAPPKDQPSRKEERARYNTHENNPEDEGYRNFLRQLYNPLSECLEPQSEGLDFGSGPGPTLSVMFEEAGHKMALYDPFYADDTSVFSRTYDFITATEVAEHLHQPAEEFERLWECLRPGGYLGLMTKMARDDVDFFAGWHYRQDFTHVTFYTIETFRWMARRWNASVWFPGERTVIFQKKKF